MKKGKLINLETTYLRCSNADIDCIAEKCSKHENILKHKRKKSKKGEYLLIETNDNIRFTVAKNRMKLQEVPAQKPEIKRLLNIMGQIGIVGIRCPNKRTEDKFHGLIKKSVNEYRKEEEIRCIRFFDRFG